jgi:Holliday junction resolvase RusA-like endonuclease
MRPIAFEVVGDPVPQPRPRITTRGKHGHAYTPASHPIHAYRAAIAAAARTAGATPIDDAPLTVVIDLVFARPPSHYRKSGELNPRSARPVPRGDCTNYAKGIEDALNGVAWKDDVQIGKVVIEKTWGAEARTTVRIS